MAESQILLLGPGGKSVRVSLLDDIPVNQLQYAVGNVLGLPGHRFIFRKQGGKLIDQRGSLLHAAVRPGDMVLVVEAGVSARPRGLRLRADTRTPIAPGTRWPSSATGSSTRVTCGLVSRRHHWTTTGTGFSSRRGRHTFRHWRETSLTASGDRRPGRQPHSGPRRSGALTCPRRSRSLPPRRAGRTRNAAPLAPDGRGEASGRRR